METQQRFYDCCCIFEKKVKGACYPFEITPSEYNFENSFPDFITNIFPPNITDDEPVVYTFTIANSNLSQQTMQF